MKPIKLEFSGLWSSTEPVCWQSLIPNDGFGLNKDPCTSTSKNPTQHSLSEHTSTPQKKTPKIALLGIQISTLMDSIKRTVSQ